MRIGDAARELRLTADTLRYYEKIRLIPRVERNRSGVRRYSEKNLSQLRFVTRAQKMGFSLREIKPLLRFREEPQKAKPEVRRMAHQKLKEIDAQLREIRTLKAELVLLTNLCQSTDDGCPILEHLDAGEFDRIDY